MGRKPKYDKQILKTLFIKGPMTAWALAKDLSGLEQGKGWYEKTQKIHSILIRKKEEGIIERLKRYQYIQQNVNGKIYCSLKGLITVLMENGSYFIYKLNPTYLSTLSDSADLIMLPSIADVVRNIDFRQFLLKTIEKTKFLIDNGMIDFNKINLVLYGKMLQEFEKILEVLGKRKEV